MQSDTPQTRDTRAGTDPQYCDVTIATSFAAVIPEGNDTACLPSILAENRQNCNNLQLDNTPTHISYRASAAAGAAHPPTGPVLGENLPVPTAESGKQRPTPVATASGQ